MPDGDPNKGTQTRQVEVKPDDFENRGINEIYKKKSLELASKYGYKRPEDKEAFHPKLNEARENFDNKKWRSKEDLIAETAHINYQQKHPEKAQKFRDNKTKYQEREHYEIDTSRSPENDTRGFNIAQERFEELRKAEAEKDDLDPDDNGGSGKAKKSSKETEKSRDDTVNKFQGNKSDITQNSLSSKFFNSLGIKDEMLKKEDNKNNKSETTRDSVSNNFFSSHGVNQNKLEQLSSKQDNNVDANKGNISEKYFRSIGFTINQSDITKNQNNDKSSVSYSFNKASNKSTDKSVDLEKE